MATETNQFFYDSQVRRFIIQFIRMMSGYQVQFGADTLKCVPVMYGDPSRQAMHILKDNSENTLNTVPAMAAYVTSLNYDRKRIQEPYFVDNKHVRMRAADPDTGELTTQQGNAYTIERLMPVPYSLKMNLDIWTSNTTQKLQLLEQIAPMFNPSFEIQSSDNYFDWTSLTTVNLTDVNWSSRSVGQGDPTDVLDIATMSFEIPIWLTPPAKVKKLGVIHRVVSSVYDVNLDDNPDEENFLDDNLLLGQRVRVSSTNYNVLLLNDPDPLITTANLTIHRHNEIVTPPNDVIDPPPVVIGDDPKISWNLVFSELGGNVCPGISQITLIMPDELNEVTGTIVEDPDDPNNLLFTVDTDTIPTNTLTPVDAVIDPLISGPGLGVVPVAAVGQRYLLINDIGAASNTIPDTAAAWEGLAPDFEPLVAKENDIVEYVADAGGDRWIVTFDASASVGTTEYLTNLTTEIQYCWSEDQWIKSWNGEYKAGYWFVTL